MWCNPNQSESDLLDLSFQELEVRTRRQSGYQSLIKTF